MSLQNWDKEVEALKHEIGVAKIAHRESRMSQNRPMISKKMDINCGN